MLFSAFWHPAIVHLNQTEDFNSGVHGQVQVLIPIELHSSSFKSIEPLVAFFV